MCAEFHMNFPEMWECVRTLEVQPRRELGICDIPLLSAVACWQKEAADACALATSRTFGPGLSQTQTYQNHD